MKHALGKFLFAAVLLAAGRARAAVDYTYQKIYVAGFCLTDRQGETSAVTALSELDGLAVQPAEGIVMADSRRASANENTLTLTVPFGYKVTHWLYDYTNFEYGVGTRLPDSEDQKTVTWNYTSTGGPRVYLAPVLSFDDRRTVTVAKSPFGLGTLSTNVGVHVCAKGDRFHVKAVPVRDDETGFDHARFRRWSDGVTDYEREFDVETNMSLVAEFVPNSWQVLFDPRGGAVFPAAKVVTCDAAYGWLPTPTRTGFDFRGWYSASTAGERRNPNATVGAVGDHTLYAQWDAIRCTINGLVDERSLNRGTVSGGGEYACGNVATLTAVPDEGFVFAGWTDGFAAARRRENVTTNATYVATFDTAYYSVTFGYYDVRGEWTTVSERVAHGGGVAAPAAGEASSHEGLPFLSWSTDAYKTNVVSDLSVDAQYERTFEVRFTYRNRDGLCVTGAVQRVYPGESATPPPATVCDIWTGYRLVGWTPDYSTVRGDLVVTAEYEIREYEVVFCYCDQVGAECRHSEFVRHGERVPFEYANGVRNLWPGHTFIAWNVNGRDVVDDSLVASNDMQVVARYEGYARISYAGGEGGQGEMPMQTYTNVAGEVRLATNAFARTGYQFDHWAGSDGETYEDGATVSISDGFVLKLTADWQPIKYTVTFDGNGGTCDEKPVQAEEYPVCCVYDEAKKVVFRNDAMQREGYDCCGLGTNKEEVLYAKTVEWKNWHPVISNLTTKADAVVTLYAIWKASKGCDVIIDGVVTNVPSGTKIEKPADPVKTGYTFAGWTTNGVPVTSWPITVSGEGLAIASAWTPITYAVAFDGNGATSGSMATESFTYDVEQALTSNAFQKTDFAFAGWTNAVGEAFADGASVSNLTATSGASVSLYAMWEKAARYAIEFNGCGGLDEKGGDVYSQSAGCGEETALLSNRFTRTGYVFANWTNGTGTVFADGAKVADLAAKDATASLGAVWTPIAYSIAFDGKGATGGEMAPMSNVVYDAATNLTANAFAKTGYAFSTWRRNEESYDDRATVSNLTAVANEEVALTAQWTANSYTVRFHPNGGSGEMAPQAMTYDVATNLTGNTYVAPSVWLVFGGWTNAAGRIFANGAGVSNLTAERDGTVDLYARWVEAATYWVRFDGNGATSGAMDDQRFRCGEGGTLNLNGYARTGCGFGGWTNAAGQAYADGYEIPTTQDLAPTGETAVLSAKWETHNYECTFIDHDGTQLHERRSIPYGDPVSYSWSDPVRAGYAFAGWTTNGVSVTLPFPMPDRDLTLAATYAPIAYSIAFDGNGAETGTMSPLENVAYETQVALTKNAFARTLHSFDGWTNSTGAAFADGQTVSNLTTTAGETVRLFAKWTKDANPLGEALGIPDLVVSNSVADAWVSLGKDLGVARTSSSPYGTLSIAVPGPGTLAGTFEQDLKPNSKVTIAYDGKTESQSPGGLTIEVAAGQDVVFSGTPGSGKTWTLKGFTWTPGK